MSISVDDNGYSDNGDNGDNGDSKAVTDADRKIINLAERLKARKTDTAPNQSSNSGLEIPEFITPKSFLELSDEQIDSIIDLLRIRRMSASLIYKKTQEEKLLAKEGHARDQLELKSDQCFNELEKVFKALDKLEKRINELRSWRLQAGIGY